jgi:16S rRNA (guanine966-N2)-methyltransferase
MSRIVAGVYGGRRLATPAGRDTRPTSDRVREALFSTLETMTGLRGARVADLYAGSGAVGLEAVSRGAAGAVLVESDARAARAVRENIRLLGAGNRVRLVVARVERVVAAPPEAPFDVVFADPPYALPEQELHRVLRGLVDNGWLADDAVMIVERSARTAPVTWVDGVTGGPGRRYGETVLWYGRRS